MNPSIKPAPRARRAAGKGRTSNRFSTTEPVKRLVWIRAAGHCEQCGTDLTQDFRTGKPTRWGEVAHVVPASPKGPRAPDAYNDAQAQLATDDPDNLMLLCPGCHDRIDTDADGYPKEDLSRTHRDHVNQIRMAAARGETQRAMGIIFLSQHFATENLIRSRDLAEAMLAEGLWADKAIEVIRLRAPGKDGRNAQYWNNVEQDIAEHLHGRLAARTSTFGDPLNLAVVGVADIPSLIRLGRQLGDRSNRFLYSRDRTHGLKWPDSAAVPPPFSFDAPSKVDGPLALVLSLSAHVANEDVRAALPDARIATFSTPEPNYSLIRNRGTIEAFRTALQPRLSVLEASTDQPIHLFPVVPAAMAIEFGALLSTQHAHRYIVYDRDESGRFVPMMELGPRAPRADDLAQTLQARSGT
jgi:hypothetical protein